MDLAVATSLLPNALLVLAAIDALDPPDHTRSPVTDDIGYALDENASWVRRHGKAVNTGWTPGLQLADLSANGRCSPGRDGRAVAALLRQAEPTHAHPARCPICGAPCAGNVHGTRVLYECGATWQFCPDHIPGHPRALVPSRSQHAQHGGRWFRARLCGEGIPGYRARMRNSSYARAQAEGMVQPSRAACGTVLEAGSTVRAARGSPAYSSHGAVDGTVVAAANGTVLVNWPAVPGDPAALNIHLQAGFPAMACELSDAGDLVLPGAPDPSGLSSYQERLRQAIASGEVAISYDAETGLPEGRFEGRRIVQRALEVLAEHRLLPPNPLVAA